MNRQTDSISTRIRRDDSRDDIWCNNQESDTTAQEEEEEYHGELDVKPSALKRATQLTMRPNYTYCTTQSKRSLCDGINEQPSLQSENSDRDLRCYREPSFRKSHRSYWNQTKWMDEWKGNYDNEPSHWRNHRLQRPESPPCLIGSETSSVETWDTDYMSCRSRASHEATTSPTKTIEVSPGFRLKLRGADETWRAISVDFYVPAECYCCNSTIFCIQDADYVLCPECRVISPLDGQVTEHGDGGVGLGFTWDDLAKWQDQICSLRNRRATSNMY